MTTNNMQKSRETAEEAVARIKREIREREEAEQRKLAGSSQPYLDRIAQQKAAAEAADKERQEKREAHRRQCQEEAEAEMTRHLKAAFLAANPVSYRSGLRAALPSYEGCLADRADPEERRGGEAFPGSLVPGILATVTVSRSQVLRALPLVVR
jgi:hypothetical protein